MQLIVFKGAVFSLCNDLLTDLQQQADFYELSYLRQ